MKLPVTVTLRHNRAQVTVSRSEAANMRLLGIALTIAEEHALIRRRIEAADKVTWHKRKSGYCGPVVMQMQR